MNDSTLTVTLCSLLALIASPVISAADPNRQAEVAERGSQVMPFSLNATTHVFTKTDDGGIQQVVAKDPKDTEQIRLIREHLRQITAEFGSGNFAGPIQIHSAQMPGLAEIKQAKPGEIAIRYQDLAGGGEIRYATTNASLAAALHRWFDAQLSDHGAHAQEGHEHHGAEHH